MKENSFLLVVLLDFQVGLGVSLTSGMTSPVSRFTRHEATNPTSQHSTGVIHKTFVSGQVDDYGMPEAETKLQSPFSRSDTLEQVILGRPEG